MSNSRQIGIDDGNGGEAVGVVIETGADGSVTVVDELRGERLERVVAAMESEHAMSESESKLCYVDAPWAYFIHGELADASGDDWNDVPYEHNAGTPSEYGGRVYTTVAFDGEFDTPRSGQTNSWYSVDNINAGTVAWLRSSQYSGGPRVVIPAGTTLARFTELIEQGGGHVYTANEKASTQ